jgi:hypothetical protein
VCLFLNALKCSFATVCVYPLLCCCGALGVADYQLAVSMWFVKGVVYSTSVHSNLVWGSVWQFD